MKKPGRPKKNLNIKIDPKKVDVNVTRKDGKTDIKIDTPKVDVDIHREKGNNSLKIDTPKVDVEVTKSDVKVDVNDQTNLFGKFVKWILRKRL
jgi:hypothetical protein